MADKTQEEFETLLHAHRAIVFKTVNTYCWRPEDRDDLAQEIAAQLWKAWPKYDSSRIFTTWMYRIALNVAISFVRKEVQHRRVFTPLEEELHEASLLPPSGDPDAVDRMERLRRFIAREPPLERGLLLLYLEEKSQKEIAEILGITPTNVSTKISRLKQRIPKRNLITIGWTAMEPTELKSTWQMLEKALERGNRLSVAMLRQQKLDAAHKSLRPLKLNQAFQIFFGVLFIVLAALLWSTKPTAISVILGGIAIQAYGVGCVITAGMVFSSLSRIDYAAPVVEVQGGLAHVRRAYGICVLVAGLSWWFLWIPLLVLLAGLVHINLYAHAPSVIWIGMATGVAGLLGMCGIYLYSLKSSNVRLRQFIERAAFGRSLQKALQQLNELRKFEEEYSS